MYAHSFESLLFSSHVYFQKATKGTKISIFNCKKNSKILKATDSYGIQNLYALQQRRKGRDFQIHKKRAFDSFPSSLLQLSKA